MPDKYRIHPKKPSAPYKIWAGPERSDGVLPTPESERHKTQREALENRLKNLLGEENVVWNKRRYCYEAELSEEQVHDIKLWPFVAGIRPVK